MNSTVSRQSLQSVISNLQDSYDYLAKVIIVGCSNTGKTCLLHRFIKNDYTPNSSQTIGVEFSSKIMVVDDVSIKLQLWDTAGQERFRSLTRTYYRGSAGVILVFDLTNRKTLDDLGEFLMDVEALTNTPSIILVGNKTDLVESTDPTLIVRDEYVLEFKEKYNIKDVPFLKTSSFNGENNWEIFNLLSGSILTKIEMGIIDPEVQSFGVQYGEVPNWNVSVASKQPNGFKSRIIRRKATTLSLVDKNLQQGGSSKCSC